MILITFDSIFGTDISEGGWALYVAGFEVVAAVAIVLLTVEEVGLPFMSIY
jgi:hypothetical protein